MPTMPVYVRKEDLVKFLQVYSPDWLHRMLDENVKLVSKQEVAITDNYNEIFGYLNPDDLTISVADQAVFDVTTGEQVEATPEMVKELKRRGQVR